MIGLVICNPVIETKPNVGFSLHLLNNDRPPPPPGVPLSVKGTVSPDF
jgi:hypothetical protein